MQQLPRGRCQNAGGTMHVHCLCRLSCQTWTLLQVTLDRSHVHLLLNNAQRGRKCIGIQPADDVTRDKRDIGYVRRLDVNVYEHVRANGRTWPDLSKDFSPAEDAPALALSNGFFFLLPLRVPLLVPPLGEHLSQQSNHVIIRGSIGRIDLSCSVLSDWP